MPLDQDLPFSIQEAPAGMGAPEDLLLWLFGATLLLLAFQVWPRGRGRRAANNA